MYLLNRKVDQTMCIDSVGSISIIQVDAPYDRHVADKYGLQQERHVSLNLFPNPEAYSELYHRSSYYAHGP